ncbi:L-sorbose 1-dehydrogenase-like isoform X1 [Rhodnius prolixus]
MEAAVHLKEFVDRKISEMDLVTLLAVLAAMLALYWPEELDPSLKPKDSSELLLQGNQLHFDFIIVGAGSAGCVLANRLSENPDWKVLLIEVGGPENYYTDVPALIETLYNTKYNWNYSTTKQHYCCLNTDGYCNFPRGRGMGGCSTINGMMYVRGNPRDFDEWEEMDNPGWNYNSVLPYFLRSENTTIKELIDSPYHSTTGPLSVSYCNYRLPINEDFIQAGREYGLDVIDYNGKTQNGIAYTQFTIRDGVTRCSSSKAYLDPIRDRANLFIFMNSLVTKVLFSASPTRRAIGVYFISDGVQYDARATKEIILSSGTIETPKLLMLSGIGPKDHLQQLNIPIVVDLPVGKHLVDHAGVFAAYKINTSVFNCCREFTNKTIEEYARDNDGELASFNWQVLAFIQRKMMPFNAWFSMAIGVSGFNYSVHQGPKAQILITLLDPKSVGEIRLKSNCYKDGPLIDPKYYSIRSDMVGLMWALRELAKYMSAAALAKYSPVWDVSDVSECLNYFSEPVTDQFLECYLKYQGNTVSYHPVGTARMGRDSYSSVVDSELRVHGIPNLRVVDASVMPKITRGNTNAPTIMIGEKGADHIISTHSLKNRK